MDLTRLAARWDGLFNHALIADPLLDYIAVSVLRVLVAVAVWQLLRALQRYLRVAVPSPVTPANLAYWARWWVWLHLRDRAVLKISAVLVAVVFLLQIPAGVAGIRNDTSPAFLAISVGFFALFLSLAREFHRLARQIAHLETHV